MSQTVVPKADAKVEVVLTLPPTLGLAGQETKMPRVSTSWHHQLKLGCAGLGPKLVFFLAQPS